jgi:hypothetical protein
LATTTLVPSTSLNLDPIVAFLHSLTCMWSRFYFT